MSDRDQGRWPPGKERGGPGAAQSRLKVSRRQAANTASIPHRGIGGEVVDLEVERARRFATPWPGWWAGRELRSWTWAERSRSRRAA
jgi:hypothetical protein